MFRLFTPEVIILFVTGLVGFLIQVPLLIVLAAKEQGVDLFDSVVMPLLWLLFAAEYGPSWAHSIGLPVAPYLEQYIHSGSIADSLSTVIKSGVIFGAIMGALGVAVTLTAHFADAIDLRLGTVWATLVSVLHSPYEEIVSRLLWFTVPALLLGKIWHTASGKPTDAVFWVVLVGVAVVVGVLGSLSTWALHEGESPTYNVGVLLLGVASAGVCGYFFWRYGLEAAIAVHVAQLVVQGLISLKFEL